ncbi:ribosome silencing factor [Bacteroidetes/Chlorobi group bacterium ChocPot_Mid]|nr:MAG: ribosome silencing factor [Bacteroidetes/Chlorobi group bacterium ChocPot_Mid]
MVKKGKPKTTKGLATFCARVCIEKLAENVHILDLRKIDTAPSDYFVICTCNSDTQMWALSESIIEKCRELGIEKPKVEGLAGSYWVLLDFFDVVMHIMLPEARNFYQLEKLWGDAKFYSVDDDGKVKTYSRD